MNVKTRIKHYENALQYLEGKGLNDMGMISYLRTNEDWGRFGSGVCELLSISIHGQMGKDISELTEFEMFHPTFGEQEDCNFWWKQSNRLARVIMLTMCIEIAKGNIEID